MKLLDYEFVTVKLVNKTLVYSILNLNLMTLGARVPRVPR